MTTRGLALLFTLALLGLAIPLRGQATQPATAPAADTRQIQQAIKELGADRFKTRQAASDRLWRAGKAAIPALVQAAKSDDAEVAARATHILQKLAWGIYSDTPEDQVQLITRYRETPADQKNNIMNEIFGSGRNIRAIEGIMSGETDPGLRSNLDSQFHQHFGELISTKLLQGETDWALPLLEAASGAEQGRRDYLAFLLLTGKLDQKIAQLSASPTAATQKDWELLVLAYRAKGDMQAAVKAARDHNCFLPGILEEAGDWKSLSDMAQDDSRINPGKRLLFHRLAGQSDRASKAVESLVAQSTASKDAPLFDQELLLNDFLPEALDVYRKRGLTTALFAQLAEQGLFAQALEVAAGAEDPANEGKFDNRVEICLRAAGLLHQLGQNDRSLKMLKSVKLPDPPKDQKEFESGFGLCSRVAAIMHDLGQDDEAAKILKSMIASPTLPNAPNFVRIAAELRTMDMTSQADDLIAQAVEDGPQSTRVQRQLSSLYAAAPGDNTTMSVAWIALTRQAPEATVKERLQKLRQAMEGKLAPAELKALADAAAAAKAHIALNVADQGVPLTRSQYLGGIVRLIMLHKDAPDLQKWFDLWAKEDISGQPEELLASHMEKQGNWLRAAELHEKAAALAGSSYSRLCCRVSQGNALIKAGQQDKGNKLIQSANLAALADEGARWMLAQTLGNCGLAELEGEQYRMVCRTGPVNSLTVANSARNVYWSLQAAHQYAAAATAMEQGRLCILRREGFWSRSNHKCTALNYYVHIALMELAREKGDWSEYASQAAVCQGFYPRDINLAIEAVTQLDKAGKTELADAVFHRSWREDQVQCKAFPQSGELRNHAAWLAACCHRKLDDALLLAQEAVALDEKAPAYLDTLAEVHFQKADRTKAAELAKRCIELNAPSNNTQMAKYYAGQLKRFESGQPSSPPEGVHDAWLRNDSEH